MSDRDAQVLQQGYYHEEVNTRLSLQILIIAQIIHTRMRITSIDHPSISSVSQDVSAASQANNGSEIINEHSIIGLH